MLWFYDVNAVMTTVDLHTMLNRKLTFCPTPGFGDIGNKYCEIPLTDNMQN
jgi:hypothetical protein